MKKLMLCSVLVLACGCTSTPPVTTSPSITTTPTGPSLLTQLAPALTTLDRAAVSELALQGWKALAKNSPNTVTASVTALKTSIEGDILPWLQKTGPLSSASSVAVLVNSKLLTTVPPELKLAIQGTLDTAVALLNVPAGSAIINSTDLGYIVAAVQGIDDSCNAFLSSNTGTTK